MSGNTVTVISPGALSLVQDAGRTGYQRFGVSVCGVMDPHALLAGNRLVGNQPGAAAVEVTFGGASFMFAAGTLVALTGAQMQAAVEGTPVPTWESFVVPPGATLEIFPAASGGLRALVCVAGGIATAPVLGSRSTHAASGLGGLNGGPLKPGDVLPLGEPQTSAGAGNAVPPGLRPLVSNEIDIRVVPGPQDDMFTDAGKTTFYSSAYTVTEQSNRQGLRLDGPEIEAVDGRYDIVSDAVVFGSVQVPGDGKPIVLMADRQTTGGYAKIGVVATVDLPLLAQARPGAVVRLSPVTVRDAQARLREANAALHAADLTAGVTRIAERMRVSGVDYDIGISTRFGRTGDPTGTAHVEVGGDALPVHIQKA